MGIDVALILSNLHHFSADETKFLNLSSSCITSFRSHAWCAHLPFAWRPTRLLLHRHNTQVCS